MTIIRMYHTAAGSQRPTNYREAWWEQDTGEFIVHHGKVGEAGTTKVEKVQEEEEAHSLLASFVHHNTTEHYVDADDVDHEEFTVVIRFKGQTPTQVETTNAEKFAIAYSGLLGWRGLGWVDQWEASTETSGFRFPVHSVHRSKASKLVGEAVKKTDFRADRVSIERS